MWGVESLIHSCDKCSNKNLMASLSAESEDSTKMRPFTITLSPCPNFCNKDFAGIWDVWITLRCDVALAELS